MKEIKQPKEKSLKVGKKVFGGIVFIAIMLIAYAILSMQQIGEIKSIAPETARALEENEFAVTMIVKDKETGEVIPGAVIVIEKQLSGTSFLPTYEQIGEYTTNDEGKIELVLEKASYRISETTAPSRYKAIEGTFNLGYLESTDENQLGVTVSDDVFPPPENTPVADGEVDCVDGVVYIYNENIGTSILINNVDKNGALLEDATFRITDAEGNLIEEVKSTNEGKEIVLKNGDYYIDEVTAPDGYRMTVRNVHIRVKNGTYYVLNNDRTEKSEANKATFLEIDLKEIVVNRYGEDGESIIPIPGATFDIYDYYEDKFIGQFTSDENGKIDLDLELELGEYAVIEKGLPEEYGTVSHINVNSQDGNIELLYSFGKEEKNAIYFVNEPNRLVINKIDEEGNPLPGVVFEFER